MSKSTNDNVYDVATFLLNIDFAKNIDLYLVDTAYKIHRINSIPNKDKLNKYLSDLQTVFLFDNFIFTQENYQNLETGESKKALIDCLANPYDSMGWYLKKQDLADFEPLQGVVNFLNVEPTPKQYPLLYKNDYFDLSECESVITGYDPSDNWHCIEREQATNLLLSSVHNGLFSPHPTRANDYIISADNFREWLKSKEIFIEGFTDKSSKENLEPTNTTTVSKQNNLNNNQIIEKIIYQADIIKIIGKHTELKRSGNEFKGCCPFHGEKTPSFYVNPQKGLYKCFGCGVGGNALTFLKEYEHMTAGEALKELSQ